MSLPYYDDLFSDFYKDAYGGRPSQAMWEYWNNSTPEWKQKILNEIQKQIDHNEIEEAHRQADALQCFEDEILENMKLGAKDRKQAIRWFLESRYISMMDLRLGANYVCWFLGLNSIHSKQFTEVIEDILD